MNKHLKVLLGCFKQTLKRDYNIDRWPQINIVILRYLKLLSYSDIIILILLGSFKYRIICANRHMF